MPAQNNWGFEASLIHGGRLDGNWIHLDQSCERGTELWRLLPEPEQLRLVGRVII